LKARRW